MPIFQAKKFLSKPKNHMVSACAAKGIKTLVRLSIAIITIMRPKPSLPTSSPEARKRNSKKTSVVSTPQPCRHIWSSASGSPLSLAVDDDEANLFGHVCRQSWQNSWIWFKIQRDLSAFLCSLTTSVWAADSPWPTSVWFSIKDRANLNLEEVKLIIQISEFHLSHFLKKLLEEQPEIFFLVHISFTKVNEGADGLPGEFQSQHPRPSSARVWELTYLAPSIAGKVPWRESTCWETEHGRGLSIHSSPSWRLCVIHPCFTRKPAGLHWGCWVLSGEGSFR